VRIAIEEYDRRWLERFRREEAKIRRALGERALRIEHVGSTSVPGLAAKPVIDVLLEVVDSADEAAYAPLLESAGYGLRIREPEWFEHRFFKDGAEVVQIHVFGAGCPEIERMLRFRDWLRANGADREWYGLKKRELAEREWERVDDYANAKTEVIEAILRRAIC